MDDFCCEGMMAAFTFDGPFYRGLKYAHGWGVALYQLTPSRRAISQAVGAHRYDPIMYCPFCGQVLEPVEEE